MSPKKAAAQVLVGDRFPTLSSLTANHQNPSFISPKQSSVEPRMSRHFSNSCSIVISQTAHISFKLNKVWNPIPLTFALLSGEFIKAALVKTCYTLTGVHMQPQQRHDTLQAFSCFGTFLEASRWAQENKIYKNPAGTRVQKSHALSHTQVEHLTHLCCA